MFGPDILVAPIMHYGMRSRNVYLPVGTKWKNAWTNDIFEGGQTVMTEARIEQIPFFIRDGAELNLLG
jgi:alpha-D-xyloside xylohydrolase